MGTQSTGIGTHLPKLGRIFEKLNRNSVLEKIGRAILLASIHNSLVYDVQRIVTSCHNMFTFLNKKFNTFSRAAQIMYGTSL
jgi:hypothetical protein